MKKKVNIRDIAEKLGVSTTLVSFVINGKAKENRISEKVEKKVLALVEELNYNPNYFAKNLREGKTNTIGLIVGDISNPFFSKIARFVEDEVGKKGYQLIVGSSDENAEKTRDIVELFVKKNIDGLLIAPSSKSYESIVWLKKQQVPFVLIDRNFSRLKTNYVGVDNALGIELAVNYFVDKNYDKIAMLAYAEGTSNIKERIKAFKKALKEKGIKVPSDYLQLISYDNTIEEIKKSIEYLTKMPNVPRAIVFATNRLGLLGINELFLKGIRIPQDISVISFDDDMAFQMSYPSITVIEQPIEKIAKQSTKLLFENIREGKGFATKQLVNPVKLISRSS